MSTMDKSRFALTEVSDDMVNLHEIWHALTRHIRTILLTTGVALGLAAFLVMRAHPLFSITSSLYTGGLKPSAGEGGGPSGDTGSSYANYLFTFQAVTDSETEVDVLTSPTIVQQAVLSSGLNARVTGDDNSSPRYWAWKFLHGGKISSFAPKDGDIKALFANFADPSIAGETYKIVFGPGGSYYIEENDKAILDGKLGSPASGGGLNLLLQMARPGFLPPQGTSYNLMVTSPAVTAAAITAGALSVSPGGTPTMPSDIINISFKWSNPYQGQEFIDQLMNNYINTVVSWNSGAAAGMEDFISTQLKDVHGQLIDADQKLADYQQKTGIISPPDNAKQAIDQQGQYEVQRSQAQVQVMALQQIWQALKTPTEGVNPYLLSQANDSALSELSEKLAEATATLQSLRVQFTASAPEVQSQEAQLHQLQIAIRSMVNNELTQAQSNLNSLNNLIDQFKSTNANMPAQSLEVISLTRSSDVLGKLYVLLMQKQQEAALSKAATVSATRVLTPAQLPLKASQPKAAIILAFAAVAGFVVGVLWVLGRRALSGRFETVSEIRRLIPLAVYGTVPRREAALSGQPLPASSFSAFAEAFRIARNNIYHGIPGKKSKLLLLTSGAVGDGKSLTAANLAKSLADDGKRVVLIDGDMRMGALHESLGLQQSPGLAEWLIDGEAATLQVPQGQKFSVLTAGVRPPNPAELLNDPGFAEVMRSLRSSYDFVVFDSAPLPVVSDALALAKQADLILSVVQLGHSRHRDVSAHMSILAPLAKRHGVIVNDLSQGSPEYAPAYGGAAQSRRGPTLKNKFAASYGRAAQVLGALSAHARAEGKRVHGRLQARFHNDRA